MPAETAQSRRGSASCELLLASTDACCGCQQRVPRNEAKAFPPLAFCPSLFVASLASYEPLDLRLAELWQIRRSAWPIVNGQIRLKTGGLVKTNKTGSQ